MKTILAIISTITAFFTFKSSNQPNKDNSSADEARNELTKLIRKWDKMRLYIISCKDATIEYENIKDSFRYIDIKLRKVQKHLNNV